MDQVLVFAQKYYTYLQVLVGELKRQYVTFCAEMKAKRFCYEGDVLERIENIFEDLFELTYSDYNELFVLVQASVYRMSLDQKE